MKEKFDKRKYAIDYRKSTYRRVDLKFNKNNETEMIEFLESKGNIQGYLKELVKKDMENK